MRCLQRMRHQVEASRQLAEFVIGVHRQAGRKITLAQTRLRALQSGHGVDHQQIAHGHEGHRRRNGQGHHAQLKQVQRGRPARNLDLNGFHKAVHLTDEVVGLRQGLVPAGARLLRPLLLQLGPVESDGVEAGAGLIAPGHKQGAGWVARAQQLQAGVKFFGMLLHGLHRLGLQHHHHAQHVHAKPPRLVHGRGTAFQLPGHPQGQANGAEGHEQEACTHRQQLGCEGWGISHRRSVGMGCPVSLDQDQDHTPAHPPKQPLSICACAPCPSVCLFPLFQRAAPRWPC